MPAPRKKPLPSTRMVELLLVEKRRLLAANGHVTRQDFEEAWDACWWTMVLERAWAHATKHRRSSRRAMLSARSEFRAAFLDEPTAFATAIARLSDAANGMCLRLEPEQTARALIAAIGYVETDDDPDFAAAA